MDEAPKQWIVMRTDLKMRKGKMIAQGAHASMKVLLDRAVWTNLGDHEKPRMTVDVSDTEREWFFGIFTKVCLRVESEEQLVEIYEKAKRVIIPCALIIDKGLTEFNGVPTKTCCAIGPALPSEVEDIVGHLKLL
jgi:PTH2 family peptidyl-tRNA hydrolase